MNYRSEAVDLLIDITGRKREQLDAFVGLLVRAIADELLQRRAEGAVDADLRAAAIDATKDAIASLAREHDSPRMFVDHRKAEAMVDAIAGLHKPLFAEVVAALGKTTEAIGHASVMLDSIVDVLSLPEGEVRSAALAELVRRRG